MRSILEGRVEPHIANRGPARGRLGQRQHPVDSVQATESVHMLVDPEPTEFGRVGQADPSRRPSGCGKETAAGQPLAVEHEVIAGLGQTSEVVTDRAKG